MGRINPWHEMECPARTVPDAECGCPPDRFLNSAARPVRGPGLGGLIAYWAAVAREAIART